MYFLCLLLDRSLHYTQINTVAISPLISARSLSSVAFPSRTYGSPLLCHPLSTLFVLCVSMPVSPDSEYGSSYSTAEGDVFRCSQVTVGVLALTAIQTLHHSGYACNIRFLRIFSGHTYPVCTNYSTTKLLMANCNLESAGMQTELRKSIVRPGVLLVG